ncbi:MAG: hypothetical protein IJX72_06255 [Clostridia bacterium]|nr:hypothetical protein [Clostridia bacterium]
MSTETKQKRALFALRAIIAFVLLGVLLAILYWWGFHSYRDVAEWVEPGNHDAFVYEGETYYLSGVIGKRGLTLKKYPIDKIVGQIKDDGTPVTTEPVTLPETETVEETDPIDAETLEETEPVTELESVIPPAGAALFEEDKHAYILYSVEDNEDFLLLLEADGEYYLYYREGAKDPLAPDTTEE